MLRNGENQLRKQRTTAELEIAALGSGVATLMLVRFALAQIAAGKADPGAFLEAARDGITADLKGAFSGMLTDKETVYAIKNGLDALDFVFDRIVIRDR